MVELHVHLSLWFLVLYLFVSLYLVCISVVIVFLQLDVVEILIDVRQVFRSKKFDKLRFFSSLGRFKTK